MHRLHCCWCRLGMGRSDQAIGRCHAWGHVRLVPELLVAPRRWGRCRQDITWCGQSLEGWCHRGRGQHCQAGTGLLRGARDGVCTHSPVDLAGLLALGQVG